MTIGETQMTENTQETAWNHRGPLPPWPAEVDLIAWLETSSQQRAAHLMRHAEKEGASEADTERVIRHWDHWAGLLKMDSRERAEQIRRDMDQAWAGFGDEIERQTQRWTKCWDQVAEAAKQRRAAAGADAR
jgi:hypothetical protein